MHECPVEPKLPVYLVVGGCFGIVKISILLWRQIKQHRDEMIDFADVGLQKMARQTNIALDVFLCVWFVFGHYWLFKIWTPHYRAPLHEPQNWCNESLFAFFFWHLIICHILIGLTLFSFLMLCSCFIFVKCFTNDTKGDV